MKTRVNEGPALERSSDDARSSSSSSRYAARCRALVRYEAAEAAFERIPKSFNNCIFSHRCYETGGDIIVDRQMDKVQETDKIKGAESNEQQKTTDIEDGRLRVWGTWCAFDVAQLLSLCTYKNSRRWGAPRTHRDPRDTKPERKKGEGEERERERERVREKEKGKNRERDTAKNEEGTEVGRFLVSSRATYRLSVCSSTASLFFIFLFFVPWARSV